jgi:hypothetical protein
MLIFLCFFIHIPTFFNVLEKIFIKKAADEYAAAFSRFQ